MEVISNQRVLEGAGVKLYRLFGFYETEKTDPFLLLDDFHSDNPDDYLAGFPWHPHRGIETVTYMISGRVEHGDSIGNKGVISSGDVQWMTAGSGIIHQEMPKRYEGMMQGFQLWVNLPKTHKMKEPRYREVKSKQIPEKTPKEGISVKIISGQFDGVKGPVQDIVVPIRYLDVSIEQGTDYDFPVEKGHKKMAYVFQGQATFQNEKTIKPGQLIIFDTEDKINCQCENSDSRFLLFSGKPIREPVAWRGPIVMNTEEELDTAFMEYNDGTLIKNKNHKKLFDKSGSRYYTKG